MTSETHSALANRIIRTARIARRAASRLFSSTSIASTVSFFFLPSLAKLLVQLRSPAYRHPPFEKCSLCDLARALRARVQARQHRSRILIRELFEERETAVWNRGRRTNPVALELRSSQLFQANDAASSEKKSALIHCGCLLSSAADVDVVLLKLWLRCVR